MPLSIKEVEDLATAAAVRAAREVHRESVEEVAERAAEKARTPHAELSELVSEAVMMTLTRLGVDTSNPLEMQRDFQHLREWRTTSTTLKQRGLLAISGIFLSGLVALFLLGLKVWLRP